MNKKIKKIITFAIVCSTFSTVIPSTLNIGLQRVYAYSDDELSSLKLTSGVSFVQTYTSKSHKYEHRIKNYDEIPIVVYAKISSNQTSVKLSTIETKATDIRVFVGEDNLKLNDIYSEIKIAKGEQKSIYIRLYDSKTATDDKYTAEYEVVVERENPTDEDEFELEDEIPANPVYGDIYLSNLILSNDNQKFDFNFDKTQSVFNVNVPENINYLKVKADPEQESYKLRINDKEIKTKGDDKDVSSLLLSKGKNLIKIRIIDSDDHKLREYYLIVTRADNTSATNQTTAQAKDQTTSTDTSTTSNTTSPNNNSQNIQTDGNWLYRKTDGTMAVGWTCIGNSWYYFDTTGAMKTGWFKDDTGKWYYLNQLGVMAKDTTIDGYKIGSDGVCLKK